MGKFTELLKDIGEKKKGIKEADISKVIKDLIDTKASGDNEEQGKLVQLLRGLAFSDDPKSDEFMKKLTGLINDANFGSLAEDDDEDEDDDSDDEVEENLTDAEKDEIKGRKEYTAELKDKLRDEDDPEEKADIKDKIKRNNAGIKMIMQKAKERKAKARN